MNTKNRYPKNMSMPTIVLTALLCAGALSLGSCDLPGGPGFGTGTLTLLLPGTTVQGAAVQNTAAGVSRTVLPDGFTGTLVYKLTLTGPGETQTLDAGGGGTTVTLDAGTWTIAAVAYDPGDLTTAVGSGSAVITVVSGQSSSVRIPMTIDPAYEAGLTEIYIHNEAELRRVGTDFAIDGSIDFYLESDIVLTEPWTPIGSFSAPFKAAFDGGGHAITVNSFGGAIKEPGDNFVYQGFFAFVEDAEIKNTTIKYELSSPVDTSTGDPSYYNSDLGGVAGYAANTTFEKTNVEVTGNFSVIFDGTSGFNVGGIVGRANDVTITNCRVSGAIEGTSDYSFSIGGIAGTISNSSGEDISGSSFTGTIDGYTPVGNASAGGIAGYMLGVEITACFAEGRIELDADSPIAGGIAGEANNGSITKSYAAGIISVSRGNTISNSYAGGIAGKSYTSVIANCYAWADVAADGSGNIYAGGIAGFTDDGSFSYGSLSLCYARGEVTASNTSGNCWAGGIAGINNQGTIEYCAALNDVISNNSLHAHAIAGGKGSSITFTHNYAANDKDISPSGTPTFDLDLDGDNTYANTNFQGPPEGAVYGSGILNWDFSGVWRWISGWDYPVLEWQNAAPGAGMEDAGIEVEIDWL